MTFGFFSRYLISGRFEARELRAVLNSVPEFGNSQTAITGTTNC